MPVDDLRNSIVARLESLNEAIPAQKKAESEVKSLKAEVATLNAKLAAADGNVSSTDFSHLVEVALRSW